MPSKYKGLGEEAAPWRSAEASAPRSEASAYPAWKLEDAKARFSEVVRLAQSGGPQRVTRRGQDAVIVVSVEDFEALLAGARPRASLVEFLRASALSEIPVERDRDRGRDPSL